ncbi:cyclin G isoform X2 [Nilaparvata lugens]|uniref:cyclin G isoform X2 n=2 Tax=Nilaparvata lugens TaxID=108931 RepID=UPI00193C9E07|nr:cyclin G isoform X2 [Nilaparvata lugens]
MFVNMRDQGFYNLERPVGSQAAGGEVRPLLSEGWQCERQPWCSRTTDGCDVIKTAMDRCDVITTAMDPPLDLPPAPDAGLHLTQLLVLQQKFQPYLRLPSHSQSGEVTVGIRNGSAHVLRCLKVWYDMPSEVLFVALNIMDRFLTRMKVKPKHMACISVSSFQLACKLVCDCEPLDVAVISQCKCSVGDLTRMQAIIATKLGLQLDREGVVTRPVTALSLLRMLDAACRDSQSAALYERLVGEGDEMWQRLEIVMCDAVCANFRPCEVALVVLCCQMDTAVPQLQPPASSSDVLDLVAFVSHLQVACTISETSFSACHLAVLQVVAVYNGESQMPHRQRLVWRVSQRTLRYLRPTTS